MNQQNKALIKEHHLRSYAKELLSNAELKPLLADAKVGDLCKLEVPKYMPDEWVQIIEIKDDSTYRCPIHTTTTRNMKVCNWDRYGNPANHGGFQLIEHQPLAPEGTAEWYVQMLLLGKKLRNIRWDNNKFSQWATLLKYQYLDGDMLRYNKEYTIGSALPLQITTAKHVWKDGWQLYTEPAIPNGFYAVTTVDPIPIILEMDNGKWIYPDGTMREFQCPNDIISYVVAEKPKPAFAVGKLVIIEERVSGVCKIIKLNDGTDGLHRVQSLGSVDSFLVSEKYLKSVHAKDVQLNFGNGICGRIVRNAKYAYDAVNVINSNCDIMSKISVSYLAEPMKSTVLQLLAAIEKEGEK